MNWNEQDMNILSFINFCVGLKNLDLNVSQDDLQRTSKELDNHLANAIKDIHEHLKMQDQKIDYIISLLERRNDYATTNEQHNIESER